MTTPTGTISMTDIQTEFGGANPIGLNEYYSGGTYVPAGLSGVPASGTISMDNLRGKTNFTPYTVIASPASVAEGSQFQVQVYPSATLYSTIYWKLTDYSTLDNSDFDTSSGTIYWDYNNQEYPLVYVSVATDTGYEGTGTFKFSVYSDAARTLQLGQTSTLTVTDTYSIGTPTLSSSVLYRYANLNPDYRAAVVYVPTSGLALATVHYEVYTSTAGQSLNANDVGAPVTLTGTIVVPTNGQIEFVVQATEWAPAVIVSSDKTVKVRFRLANSSGALLATSPDITLYRTPNVSFSASPTSIREGYTTSTVSYMDSIPITNPASASVFFTIEGSTATLVNDFLGWSVNSGEIPFTSKTMYGAFTAKIDGITESDETLKITIRKNSTTGTPFWIIGDNPPSNPPITIESPAQVIVASATDTTVQIDNVSAYPESRTFNVLWRVKPNGTSTYGSYNTPITGQVLTADAYTMTAPAIGYTTNPGNHNGSYDYEIKLSSFGYADYTITRTASAQTFPVHGLEVRIAGANSSGATRQIYMTVTSTPTFPVARTYQIQFSIRDWQSTVWGAWGDLAYPAGTLQTITVGANATASAEKLIYQGPGSAQFDLKFRLVLVGHEIKESNELLDIWLG